MVFTDFSGEEVALQIFGKSLRKDRLAHAYLISGGNIDLLDSFVIRLARILICEAPSGVGPDFCGQCRICRQILDAIKKADEKCVRPESKSRMIIDQIREAFQHADVSWVRPESKSRVIRIGQIRDAEDTVHLKARSSLFKVIIVSGADRMNVEAQNAFLKTLEEPPARSVILLVSTEPQRLLDTIISRCQRLRLGGGADALNEADPRWLVNLYERIREIGLHGKKSETEKKIKEIQKNLEDASPLQASDRLPPKICKSYEQELKDLCKYKQKLKTVKWLIGLCKRIQNAKTSADANSNIFLSDQKLKEKASIWLVGLCERIRNEETSADANSNIFLSDQELMAVMWLVSLYEEGQRKGTRGKITGNLVDLLNEKKSEIEKTLTDASPLKKKPKTKKTPAKKSRPEASGNLEPDLRERYKKELNALIEAEYRRQRADLLSILQWFLRDVWLHTLRADGSLLRFPQLAQESRWIADRISPTKAMKNIEIVEKSLWQLQNTNVQEVLAIEVAIRKISL